MSFEQVPHRLSWLSAGHIQYESSTFPPWGSTFLDNLCAPGSQTRVPFHHEASSVILTDIELYTLAIGGLRAGSASFAGLCVVQTSSQPRTLGPLRA